MRNLGYKRVLFLFFCSVVFYGSVSAMEEQPIQGQGLTLMDLPSEIHEQIVESLISGNLDTPQSIVNALKPAIGFLVTSKYFDQFRNALARKLKHEIITQVNTEQEVAKLIQDAFKIAVDKNYPRMALILGLTGKLSEPTFGSNLIGGVCSCGKHDFRRERTVKKTCIYACKIT